MNNKGNLLLIGSESHIGKNFVSLYRDKFKNIICVDNKNSSLSEIYIKIDFLDKSAYDRLSQKISSLNLKIDFIIFTSGVNYTNDIFSLDEENWDKTFNINVKSAAFSIKSVYNNLNSKVSIVLISSQNGVVGNDKRIDYGPSKSALIQLAKNLSVDFSKIKNKDIRINTISPSYIQNKDNTYILNSNIGKKILKKIPYNKFVQQEDVSNTIYFLLSDNSIAIRGQNIIIDYGYTIV